MLWKLAFAHYHSVGDIYSQKDSWYGFDSASVVSGLVASYLDLPHIHLPGDHSSLRDLLSQLGISQKGTAHQIGAHRAGQMLQHEQLHHGGGEGCIAQIVNNILGALHSVALVVFDFG